MSTLNKYKEKRDFKKTTEPIGKLQQSEVTHNRFVIHKHDARRTHYDFRIRVKNVLVCWAIPKKPLLDPEVRRLAVKTEDHPVDYISFEGIIPKGSYGAGTVIIWDTGFFYLNEDNEIADEDLLEEKIKAGHIKIFLRGKKLMGLFNLFRTSGEGDKEQWIFQKAKDNYVNNGYDPDDDSVIGRESNKTLGLPQDIKDLQHIPGAEKKDIFSKKIKPMFATLVDRPFDNDDWLFELKYDGYRVISVKNEDEVSLFSRYGNTFNDKYKVIHEAVSKLEGSFVIDGEVIVLDNDGRTNFQALQELTPESIKRLYYYVFDLLWLNGYDLRKTPLVERKLLLRSFLKEKHPQIRYSDHVEVQGIALFNEAQKNNLEGIIAKRKSSPYSEGARNGDWLKIKITNRQELIIVGYTPPQKSRAYFGSLLTAAYKAGKLTYTGRVGTGFDDKMLKMLYDLMQPLKTSTPVVEAPDAKKVQWVKPELVGEVRFAVWTHDNVMRQPSFISLRTDKPAKEVIIETIQKVQANKTASAPSKVKISNPNKIFWPDQKIKKVDVVNYYSDIAETILPYLVNRPQSLYRTPNGALEEGFFQKDVKGKVPDWVETIVIKEDTEEDKEWMLCQDKNTLLYMANLGCIEINPWNSSVPNLDNPDYVVFDLDPVEIGFAKVVDVAAQIKILFDKYELPFYCKTSGSRGMHIYLPVEPIYSYEQGQQFVKLLETIVSQELKDITSFVRNPNERKGRVYLDFLQNAKGKTMSSAYSLRPRPGATVSTPIRWQELNKKLNPSDFNIFTLRDRLDKYGDVWDGFFENRINISKVIGKMERVNR